MENFVPDWPWWRARLLIYASVAGSILLIAGAAQLIWLIIHDLVAQ